MSANRRRAVALLALSVSALTAIHGGGSAAAESAADRCDQQCQAELERARAATGKYIDVTAATGDRFVESSPCKSSSAGTLGIQYANLERSSDQMLDAEQPESLLYVREGNSESRRLVALEYSVPFEGQPPPELLGRQLSGPEEARSPGLPDQYVLRVWLYSKNPDGLFAPANPAEACDAAGLVDWHAITEDCHEVTGTIPAPAERVRRLGSVPERFRLRGEDEKGGGTAQLIVGAHRCESGAFDDGTSVAPLIFGHYEAWLDPDDYVGVDLLASRYLFRFFFEDKDVAKGVGQRMGLGPDVVVHSPDIVRDYNPIAGIGDPNYSFSAPDFVLKAAVSDPGPAGAFPGTVRIWHQTPRGTARAHIWTDGSRLSPAAVEVTPRPGTLLAEMVGCAPDVASCAPLPAENGLVIRWERGADRFTAR